MAGRGLSRFARTFELVASFVMRSLHSSRSGSREYLNAHRRKAVFEHVHESNMRYNTINRKNLRLLTSLRLLVSMNISAKSSDLFMVSVQICFPSAKNDSHPRVINKKAGDRQSN